MPGLPAYFTAKDIAGSLKISEDTIYRNALLFGGVRIGGQWRFPPDAVEKYLNATGQKKNKSRMALALDQNDQRHSQMEPVHLSHGEGSRSSRIKVRRNGDVGQERDPIGLRAYVVRNGETTHRAKG